MNYYIIVPSAASFCSSLGLQSIYSPILIGATSVTSFISVIWQAQIISKKRVTNGTSLQYNLRMRLLLCALFGLLGNILYSLAHDIGFIPIAFLGRLLVGLSSSESINKHFVAVTMSSDSVVKEMATLRKAHMKGMFLGLLCGAVFKGVDGEKVFFEGSKYVFVFDFKTMPGYFMAMLWLVHIIGLLYIGNVDVTSSFNNLENRGEGADIGVEDQDKKSPAASFARSVYDSEVSSIPTSLQSLVLIRDTSEISVAESLESRNRNSGIPIPKPKKRGFTGVLKRMRKLIFLNNALPVTLILLLFSTITTEIIFSSCAIMTHRYFRWSGSSAGFFLSILTALIYPIYRATAYWSRYRDERTMMKVSTVFYYYR